MSSTVSCSSSHCSPQLTVEQDSANAWKLKEKGDEARYIHEKVCHMNRSHEGLDIDRFVI